MVVGLDDMYDIVLDVEDIKKLVLGKMLRKIGLFDKSSILCGGDLIMLLIWGLGLFMLLCLEWFYFVIGDEIDVFWFFG